MLDTTADNASAIAPAGAPHSRAAYVGRQPIFDVSRRVVGYELLFRDGHSAMARLGSPDEASGDVVANAILDIGLERLVAGRTAFLNVTGSFLESGLHRLLPPGRVVLELLEHEAVDDRLVETLQAARADGYRIALDDFVCGSDHRALLGLVDIVKVDFLGNAREDLAGLANELHRHRVMLLAEKVERHGHFYDAQAIGCTLFQGFFFQRPEVVEGRKIDADRITVLRLLVELERPDSQLERLEAIIATDPGLTYRLLSLVNAAAIGLPRRVETLREAIVMLGFHTVRNLALLIMLARVGDKPAEVTAAAMVRAKLCETLAGQGDDAHAAFTVGLVSFLDAVLDEPITDVIGQLPVSDAVAAAVVSREGRLGRLLDTAICYERWELDRLGELGADGDEVSQAYVAAVAWADAVRRDLFGPDHH